MSDNSHAHQIEKSDRHGWHVYAISENDGGYSKVGTASAPKYRISDLQGGNPRPLVVACIWHLNSRAIAHAVEKAALRELDTDRLVGRDWFKVTPERLVETIEQLMSDMGIVPRARIK